MARLARLPTVVSVGLTGGIGSGKSEVARLLAEHGAVVIDADELARAVLAPGTPELAMVVEHFGSDLLTPDGQLDRPALGRRVFADDSAREWLNGVVHPEVARRSAALAARAPASSVVVHDVPLLVENELQGRYDVVVVVEAAERTRLARLRESRGMTEQDAQARIAAQASDAERRTVAGVVLVNDGSLSALRDQVATLWQQLAVRAPHDRPCTSEDGADDVLGRNLDGLGSSGQHSGRGGDRS